MSDAEFADKLREPREWHPIHAMRMCEFWYQVIAKGLGYN